MKTLTVTDSELTMITDALKGQALRCVNTAVAEIGAATSDETATTAALCRGLAAEAKAHRALAERLARGEPPREGTALDAVIVNLTPREIADASITEDIATRCNHPADNATNETLLMECPDCGAECSGTQVSDDPRYDQLCYDERCPLHATAGALPAAATTQTTTPAREACESGDVTGERCQSDEGATVTVRYVPAQHRGTAEALGGSWAGLTRTMTVCEGCAESIAKWEDAEWYEVRP